ncbi:hypothetical protein [Kangiella sp. TOML190]|uniref:hypothetical protein n=1 Tax=Kangiella sp. TOML190 TaxID=2931351 RepID=UPI00204243EE|nr:hypothetical protein [Kangiella sp. TOML190]
MKKIIIGSFIVVGLVGAAYYFSSNSKATSVTKIEHIAEVPQDQIQANVGRYEDQKSIKKDTVKSESKHVKDDLKAKKSEPKLDKNKIYEDALRSVVDKDSLQASQNKVFIQYENDIVTAESDAVRNLFYDKVYSSEAYDSLLAKNIRFTDIACKKTLCKVDFALPKDSAVTGFEIPSTLIDNNLINLSHGANFHSEESDGVIHFYIATEAVSN